MSPLHQHAIRRSSVRSLVGALVVSTLLYPILLFLFGLSAQDNNTGTVVFVFVAPAAAWLVLAAYIGWLWWKGWSRPWKVSMLGIIGGLFWPALFLLFNAGIRRAMLPRRPWHPGGYCQYCGAPWPPDARYCQHCGAARSEMATV